MENVQRLVDHNRRDRGFDGPDAAARPVASVGIIGAGSMGTAIAAAEVRQGVPVTITDVDRRVLTGLSKRVVAELAAEMPGEKAQEMVDRLLTVSIASGPVLRCDLVIDAIVETLPAKQKLYADVELQFRGGAVLATNTSTIPVGRLATALDDPTRFCGIHFCHPVRQRPLVEIVRGPKTSDATIAAVVGHIKAIGRMPLVVDDGPGFLINRLLLPYVSQALELLLEGASISAIEQTAVEFGMALGPLRLLDEIGLDTILQGCWTLIEAFPERIATSPLLAAMIREGRLGRKVGQGFFEYPQGDDASLHRPHPADNEQVNRLIAECARQPERHNGHTITMRLVLPMLSEATRVLEDKKVRDPRDIDLGAIFGLGFPPTKGGLLWWADSFGAARVIEMFRPLERLGLGGQPSPYLRQLARTAGRFYI